MIMKMLKSLNKTIYHNLKSFMSYTFRPGQWIRSPDLVTLLYKRFRRLQTALSIIRPMKKPRNEKIAQLKLQLSSVIHSSIIVF